MVAASASPCRLRQPIARPLLGGQRLASSARSRRPAPSSAAAGAAASGNALVAEQPPARARTAPYARARRRNAPAPSSRRPVTAGALVDPHAERRGAPAQPPGEPGRVDQGGAVAVPQPARYVGESTSARTCVARRAARRRGRAGRQLGAARSASSSTCCGAVATASSPVRSQVAVDAVLVDVSARCRQVLPARAVRAGRARRASARRRCRARGSGWPTQKPPLRPDAAQPQCPASSSTTSRSRVAAPWPAARSTARCSRRRRRPGRPSPAPRSAGSGLRPRAGRRASTAVARRVGQRPRAAAAVARATSGRRVGAASRPRRASTQDESAIRNIAVPITLTCGGMPRCAEPQTNIGKVTVLPALKFVMMKSSKDSEKLSSAARQDARAAPAAG